MAISLSAVFRVQDRGSAQLSRITRNMQQTNRVTQQIARATDTYRDANGRLRNALGQYVAQTNHANNASRRFSTSLNGLRVGASGISASLGGMQSALLGIVGAYISAQGAAAAFNATIGAAAKYEQNAMALSGMFQDANKAQKYLQMIEQMAIESPVLNSGEMADNSKAFVGMTKDMKQLEKAWKLVERVQAYTGADTRQATFSTKEVLQGDYVSMYEITGFDKKTLQSIAKMGDIEKQIAALDSLMSGMGINNEMITNMGNTTLGQWASINELVESFLRKVGMDGNSKLSETLKGVNDELSKLMTDDFAGKLGDKLGGIVDKAIEIGQWLWKWREPVAYIVGALSAAAGVFIAIGAISLLANPLALISAGVAAAVVGFKALYDNSETVRNVIDGLVGKAKELWSVFKANGAGGVLDSLFGDGTAEKVTQIIDTVKTKFGELQGGFSVVKDALAQGWSVISDIFSSAWTIIQPVLSGIWSLLQVVGEYAMIAFNNIIAPALSFVMQLFSTLWAIAQPILTILGGMFEVFGAIVKAIWDNVLSPIVEFISNRFKSAFEGLSDALSVVSGWFEKVGSWANTAKGYLSQFADVISGIKMPEWITGGISTTVSAVGNFLGAGESKGKSHYHGLSNVPYDGYSANLHKGERVLTAQENKEYSSGQGGGGNGAITIAKLADQIVVREDADIEKIADRLVAGIMEKRGEFG